MMPDDTMDDFDDDFDGDIDPYQIEKDQFFCAARLFETCHKESFESILKQLNSKLKGLPVRERSQFLNGMEFVSELVKSVHEANAAISLKLGEDMSDELDEDIEVDPLSHSTCAALAIALSRRFLKSKRNHIGEETTDQPA